MRQRTFIGVKTYQPITDLTFINQKRVLDDHPDSIGKMYDLNEDPSAGITTANQ